MKALIIAILILFFAAEANAQVIFRNDFVINRREKKIFNLGLTTVTINLGRYPNWNQLINGRGGRTMVIDVRALRNREVNYTYTELAEKIYTPAMFTPPVTQKIPMFLLIGPYGKNHSYSFQGQAIKLKNIEL